MEFVIAYITVATQEEARLIAHAAIEEKLAACANILDGMTAIYSWQGRVEEAREAVLILKTRAELFDRLSARVRELHSYDVPCVIALPISQGNSQYLEWLAQETA